MCLNEICVLYNNQFFYSDSVDFCVTREPFSRCCHWANSFHFCVFVSPRRSCWLRTSGTGNAEVALRSVLWKEEMSGARPSSWNSWRLCSDQNRHSWRRPLPMMCLIVRRKTVSDSTSKYIMLPLHWSHKTVETDFNYLPISHPFFLIFFLSVYDNSGNLVIQEVAKQPLTQDLLKSSVISVHSLRMFPRC